MVFTSFVILMTAVALSQAQGRGNPCENHSCQNGATCSFPLDYPICQCQPGFYGPYCENATDVRPGRCAISGDGSSPYGRCDTDFDCPDTMKCCWTITQSVCTDQVVHDPCYNYCYNGGECTAPYDAPFCSCAAGFEGKRCETRSTSNSSGSCPVITPGSFGVCGGVFCSSDSECTGGQKCCPSACGGQLCTNVATPPPLTCANVLCNIDTVCRHVINSTSCQLLPRCIRKEEIESGADDICRGRNYSEAVLVENTRYYSNYTAFTCGGVDHKCTCPGDSECLVEGRGHGACCRGKISPVPPREKPGSCPIGNISVCGGIFCTYDSDCPGDQKCCSGCGRLCTNPVTELCGDKTCAPGEKCHYISPPCPVGRACAAYVIPKCVPAACDKCPNQCIETATGHRCPSVEPVDPCGGCPRGRVCRDTGIRCITTPCPSFRCLLENATACLKNCSPGFACELQPAACPANSRVCLLSLVPTCLPIPPQTRKCPRVPYGLLPSTVPCWREPRTTLCTSDRDCRRRNQKCCLSACGRRVCATFTSG